EHVLFLSASQTLAKEFKNRGLDFDLDVTLLPPGMTVPDQPGIYATTYDTLRLREGMENHDWDFVIADEIAGARRWFESKRGAKMKILGGNAKKVLYMSATPYHTALEVGHMDALGLWESQ